jgi:regulatory protein
MATMRSRTRRDPNAEPITDPDATREAALKILERKRRTRSDLERRLLDKGFAQTAITPVVDRLTEVGLIDDQEFARAFLSGRWGRKPAGWSRLKQELKAKGIDEEVVAAARVQIEERDGVVDEVETARKLVEQARRRYVRDDPRKAQNKLYALLARRGFSGDVIRRALALPIVGSDEE